MRGLADVAEAVLEETSKLGSERGELVAGYADDLGGAVLRDSASCHLRYRSEPVVGARRWEPAVHDGEASSAGRRVLARLIAIQRSTVAGRHRHPLPAAQSERGPAGGLKGRTVVALDARHVARRVGSKPSGRNGGAHFGVRSFGGEVDCDAGTRGLDEQELLPECGHSVEAGCGLFHGVICSIVGKAVCSGSGSDSTSRYSAMPNGFELSSRAYSATTSFLLLHSRRPIVLPSVAGSRS